MFDLPWVLLLAPWSIMWFAFCVVLFIGFVAATHDDDHIGLAVVMTITGVIFYTMFGPGIDVLAWMAANLKTMAMVAGGYASVGVGWCFFKWFRFAIEARDRYLLLLEQYKTGNPGLDSRYDSAEGYIRTHWPFRTTFDDESNTLFRPAAKVYKAKIAHWVLYWPLSVLWTGLEEWIIALKDLIFECIGGALDKISAWAWRGVDFK